MRDESYLTLHKHRIYRSVPLVAHSPTGEHLKPAFPSQTSAPPLMGSASATRPASSNWTDPMMTLKRSYKPAKPATTYGFVSPLAPRRRSLNTGTAGPLGPKPEPLTRATQPPVGRAHVHLSDEPFGSIHGRAAATLPSWEHETFGAAWQEVYISAPPLKPAISARLRPMPQSALNTAENFPLTPLSPTEIGDSP